MIRFTWLRFRVQAIVSAVTLATFAVLLAPPGRTWPTHTTPPLAPCHGTTDCARPPTSLRRWPAPLRDRRPDETASSCWPRPHRPLLGSAAGGPRTRDRDLRLAWNQCITRTRWLAVKLAIGACRHDRRRALSLMQTWWAVPISQPSRRLRHRCPRAGSAADLRHPRHRPARLRRVRLRPRGRGRDAIRRTLPAMAVTLAIFAALQLAMPLWMRPHLAPPDHTVIPVTALGGAATSHRPARAARYLQPFRLTIPGQPGAWILSSGPVNAAGQPPAPPRSPAHR